MPWWTVGPLLSDSVRQRFASRVPPSSAPRAAGSLGAPFESGIITPLLARIRPTQEILAGEICAVPTVVAVHARVVDDNRAQKYDKLRLRVLQIPVGKEVADDGHAIYTGDGVLGIVDAILDQPAHHCDIAARDPDHRLQFARLDLRDLTDDRRYVATRHLGAARVRER